MNSAKTTWHFEDVDLYEILCPYKYSDHLKSHPLHAFNKHDFLFMEGEPSRDVYLVASGKVKIAYCDDIGNEYIIAFLGRGEILGEMSIFGDARHKNFAQVVQDRTMICKLRAEKARELARDYIPFSLTLNKVIGERMQKFERRLQILLFKDARQRLIEFLKDLCRDVGKPYRTGIKIDLDITQSDIAALIGTSRKTVSLLFTDLEEQGLVKFYGRKEIYIPEITKLVTVQPLKA